MRTGKKEEGRGKRAGDGKDALLSVPSDTVESLRAHVSRLHAERGEEVLLAREIRENGKSLERGGDDGCEQAWREEYDEQWSRVDALTEQIVAYEAELAARGGAEGAERAPLLRDPAVELPELPMNQVVVRGGKELSVAVYAVGRTWLEEDGNPIDDVTAWCPFGEAAEALKAATREVRHG